MLAGEGAEKLVGAASRDVAPLAVTPVLHVAANRLDAGTARTGGALARAASTVAEDRLRDPVRGPAVGEVPLMPSRTRSDTP